MPPLHIPIKISTLTVLSNNIAISIAGQHFKTLEYVGVVHLFEDFDLGEEQLLEAFGF